MDPYSMFDNAQYFSSRSSRTERMSHTERTEFTEEASPCLASNKDSAFGAFKKKEIIKTPVPKQTHKGTFKPVSSASKMPTNPQNVMGFYVGERVEHSTFGQGEILEITGDGDNRKAKIDFDDFGEKQLLLKYARLSKV